ncbi:MAG: fumarylacetoacetate hydrolase family protein [Synergistetes bacterium]|nr:fumarylacetoacetate hydrolase family protein [Synergistota bacterium]
MLDGRERWGLVEGERIKLLRGSSLSDIVENVEAEDEVSFSDVRMLSPISPTKIVALGLNYKDHAEETGLPVPDEPLIFLKPPSAVIGSGETILIPKGVGRVDYEAELAVVIGRKCKNVSEEKASEYILGYTCFNDVTARHLQKKDGQWTRSKSFDTFAPVGPWISMELDPSDLAIKLYLNGEIRQSSRTSRMIFNVYQVVSFVSRVMTLEPGDVIATGTPSGIGPIKDGDEVVVEIEGIGKLINYVKEEMV